MTATQETVFLTREGVLRLEARIAAARAEFEAICRDNPAAAESGDSSVWHDNFAFEENQRQMQRLAKRVRELEQLRDRAVTVEAPARPPSEVVLGARVLYQVDGEPTPRRIAIGGFDDGDAAAGVVSYNSPLGRALLGLRVGDEAELRLAGKSCNATILHLEGREPEEPACAAA
jgi:transcription elongation factor GreA